MSNEDKALLEIALSALMFVGIFGILFLCWWELRKNNKRGK